MRLHANARTCPNCRRVLIRQVLEEGRRVGQVAAEFNVSTGTVYKWLRRFRQEGDPGLVDRPSAPHRSPYRYPPPTEALRQALFRTLHSPPTDFGFNRTSWRLGDLLKVLKQRGFAVNQRIMGRLIRDAGYRWRKAKITLTSNDPKFREKLDRVQSVLAGLDECEAFFSIDEFGPFAIRLRGGRNLIGPGQVHTVPQWQKSRGCVMLVAALELASNQVTHQYGNRKTTEEMIQLLNALVQKYGDRKRLFLSWDAAPWHRSRRLFDHIGDHNAVAKARRQPLLQVVPLPAGAQFLNVIESVFSGMARAIIHNSDYPGELAAREAIDRYFAERNEHFRLNPKRAGKKIWGLERVPSSFAEGNNCKDPKYG